MLEAAAAVSDFHVHLPSPTSLSSKWLPLQQQLHRCNRLRPVSLKRSGLRVASGDCSRGPREAGVGGEAEVLTNKKFRGSSRRVFFLDVNPLCYAGSRPSLSSFAHWISLFFSEVSLTDPIIAVLDGDGANDYRRQILPSYKAHRRRFSKEISAFRQTSRVIDSPPFSATTLVTDFLKNCNVPVLKLKDYEADDVIATLVDQVLQRGYRAVIGSPDKDFKQLISEDVQIVMPMPEFGRWSFYTLKHYMAQYDCDPRSDLSLRCIMGDEVDGVPGIQHLVPSFGRKTALKLLRKHGSLENLLQAAAIRTVGKQYAQDALTKHADYLRKNYEVLSLRRDVDVHLEEKWLYERDTSNDSAVLSSFMKELGQSQKLSYRNASISG
ncbi:hypothetical protein ACLOJK_033235 [Asimina triloba]